MLMRIYTPIFIWLFHTVSVSNANALSKEKFPHSNSGLVFDADQWPFFFKCFKLMRFIFN